jgi:uncharacterized protein YodC (DUF2158 family)
MEFKAGDTVKLKSGGPVMTVAGKSTIGQIICQWFDKDELKNGRFNAESLEAANPQMQPKR